MLSSVEISPTYQLDGLQVAMVWKPGQSGNPTGRKAGMTNQNGARIRAAFVRLFDADPSKLDKMALACWEKAVAGDVPAQTFIRDTIDGRPFQRIDTGDPRPLLIVSGVIRANVEQRVNGKSDPQQLEPRSLMLPQPKRE